MFDGSHSKMPVYKMCIIHADDEPSGTVEAYDKIETWSCYENRTSIKTSRKFLKDSGYNFKVEESFYLDEDGVGNRIIRWFVEIPDSEKHNFDS